MKKIIRTISISILFSFYLLSAAAQKNNSTKTAAADTAKKVLPGKIEKAQADADNYVRMAEAAKGKLKILFPSKPGDTVYVVVAGINYTDPNLKLLKQKMDDIKSTRGLTSSYRNNTVIVKIIYKGGNASKLYDNLSDDVKELFVAEDIDGSRMILNYKLAKPVEPSGEKSL